MQDTEKASSTLVISGSATIMNAQKIHESIVTEYSSGEALCLEIQDLAEVDLTFVQLLESTRRTAAEGGRRIFLSSPATGPLLDLLQRGGFLVSPDARFFWLQEGLA